MASACLHGYRWNYRLKYASGWPGRCNSYGRMPSQIQLFIILAAGLIAMLSATFSTAQARKASKDIAPGSRR
jgi:hypothetical protein